MKIGDRINVNEKIVSGTITDIFNGKYYVTFDNIGGIYQPDQLEQIQPELKKELPFLIPGNYYEFYINNGEWVKGRLIGMCDLDFIFKHKYNGKFISSPMYRGVTEETITITKSEYERLRSLEKPL